MERDALENEIFDLADELVKREPTKVDKIMYETIDVENIRHNSISDLKNALKQLKNIAKKLGQQQNI